MGVATVHTHLDSNASGLVDLELLADRSGFKQQIEQIGRSDATCTRNRLAINAIGVTVDFPSLRVTRSCLPGSDADAR